MATKADYAHWCYELIAGEDYFIDELYNELRKDGYIDEDQEWIDEEG